jgi:hypothetical protein
MTVNGDELRTGDDVIRFALGDKHRSFFCRRDRGNAESAARGNSYNLAENAERYSQQDQDGSSGATQSRPFPARAVKRVESAGPIRQDPRGTGSQSVATHPALFPS